MSEWPATKAKRVWQALLRIGWKLKRVAGSHQVLERDGWPDFVFAFHFSRTITPRELRRLARYTGLRPEDL